MKTIIKAIVAVAPILAASSAGAMLKCNIDGKVVYQDAPCLNGGGTAVKPPTSPLPSGAPQAPAAKHAGGAVQKDSTRTASEEAFQRYMASGDYVRALAFAADDKQKNKAREAQRKKEEKCNDLRIKRDEAEANSKGGSGRPQHAAEAAQARYSAQCR